MTDKDHSKPDEGSEETSPEKTVPSVDQAEEQVSAPENSEQKETTPEETTSEEKGSEEKGEGAGASQESKEETAQDLLKSDLDGVKVRKAKGSKNVTSGICHVLATFNNTKVTFSDLKGNVISWSSSGKCNFRGSRKSTAYAAQVVTQDAGRAAMSHGMKEIVVKVKGPGMGRDSAVRTLQSLGFIVSSIIDVTPVPHNGCRPPKRRRV